MLFPHDWTAWDREDGAAVDAAAVAQLESGGILLFPQLAFEVRAAERDFFVPSMAIAKNVSFDPASGRVGGARATGDEAVALGSWLRRFSDSAAALVDAALPDYRGRLERGRASFRPAEIAGRQTSWRHDDTRLHVDSFPATPVQGRRILRVFTNVNPEGRPRTWRVGEAFDRVALRFHGRFRLPFPLTAAVLRAVRITKTRRSPYDTLMLQLHDLMKADGAYQASAVQTEVSFSAGSTWVAFTDAVSHAATSGQYQLEQTFLLPVEAMLQPEASPLRILERLTRRPLV
ncbi:MAG: Kdo hydroxylase family protein [Acidobacteriota bacterium]